MIVVHPDREPTPIVRPVVLIQPDHSHSVTETPTVFVHPEIPEPEILVKPIINEIGPGAGHVNLPNYDSNWCILGYSFVLGAACLANIVNLVNTWSTDALTHKLSIRYSVMILNLAFFLEGFAFWFSTDYSYEMRFVSQNIFFMLVTMAIFHHVFTNMPPSNNDIMNVGRAWFYWAFAAAVGMTWLLVGQERAENFWIRWAFNLSWSGLLAFAAILGEVTLNHRDVSDKLR
jgi:hypothetical protein